MNVDFSTINLQYLLKTHRIAQGHPELASSVLGLPIDLIHTFSHITDESLAEIAQVKTPLLVTRGDSWLWSRLFNAMKDYRQEEIKDILEHANLAVVVRM